MKSLPYALRFFRTGIATALSFAGALVLHWYLAKKIGQQELGQYVLFVSLVLGAQLIIRFGSDQYVLRETSHAAIFGRNHSNTPIKSAILFALLNSLIVVLIGLCVSFTFSSYLEPKLKVIIISALLFAPIFTVTSLYAPYLRAKQRSEYSPIWEQSGISLITLLVLLFVSGFKILTLWSSIAVFVALSCLLATYPIALRSQERKSWRDVASGSKYFGVQQIAQYLSTTLILVVCGLLFSEEALANLSTAQRLSLLISFPLIVMNAVTAPKFATMFDAKQLVELKFYSWRTSETATIFAFIVAIPLFFFSEGLLKALFGPNFVEAALDLKILTCAQFFNVITGSSLTLLNMSGHSRISMQIALATALLAIVLLTIALVLHEFRFLGTILASSLVFSNLLAMLACKKFLGFYPSFPLFWRMVTNA